MSHRHLFSALIPVMALLLPFAADAEIFKCVATNGELTFSQTPCPEKESEVTVMRSAKSANGEPADCEDASRFALSTAKEMKSGTGSGALFDRYGGLDALSKGSVSLISYVFEFRASNDVSAEKVSALAAAKCRARSFGDVSCEQLPMSYTDSLGGCNKNDEDDRVDETLRANLTPEHSPIQDSRSEQESAAALRKRNRDASKREEEQRLQCRKNIKAQIDSINSQMRSGYSSSQGDALKTKRRALKDKLGNC